jgi:hypothetical protein
MVCGVCFAHFLQNIFLTLGTFILLPLLFLFQGRFQRFALEFQSLRLF